jgi:hypothetical protein
VVGKIRGEKGTRMRESNGPSGEKMVVLESYRLDYNDDHRRSGCGSVYRQTKLGCQEERGSDLP